MSEQTEAPQLTQEDVQQVFDEAKGQWDAMVKKSGLTEAELIALNPAQVVSTFIAGYRHAVKYVEALGLKMPELFPGENAILVNIDEDVQRKINNVKLKAELTAVEYNVARLLYYGNPMSVSDEDDEDLRHGAEGLIEKGLAEVMEDKWLLTDLGIEVFSS